MRSEVDIILDRMKNKRVTTVVQTGYLMAKLTKAFAKTAKTYIYTPATFNPFEDEPNIVFSNQEPNKAATHFKKKNGVADVIYLGGIKDYLSIRVALGMWGANSRPGTLFFIPNSGEDAAQTSIKDYIKEIDEEAFSVEVEDGLTIVERLV